MPESAQNEEADRKARLLTRLETERAPLAEFYDGLTEEQLAQQTGEEGWTVQETLAHLISAETGMLTLVKRALDGKNKAIDPDFDFHAYNRKRALNLNHLSREELLAELAQARRDTITYYNTLEGSNFEVMLDHPLAGRMDVRTLFKVILIHEADHLALTKVALTK